MIEQGRKLQAGDTGVALIGKDLADRIGKKVGNKVDIDDHDFEIVGVFQSNSMVENSTAIVSLRDLQELMDQSGKVTEFDVALASDLPDKKAAIERIPQES